MKLVKYISFLLLGANKWLLLYSWWLVTCPQPFAVVSQLGARCVCNNCEVGGVLGVCDVCRVGGV